MTKLLYSPDEAAAALALPRTKVYELLRSGVLPSFKEGKRRLIPLSGIEKFAQRADAPGAVE